MLNIFSVVISLLPAIFSGKAQPYPGQNQEAPQHRASHGGNKESGIKGKGSSRAASSALPPRGIGVVSAPPKNPTAQGAFETPLRSRALIRDTTEENSPPPKDKVRKLTENQPSFVDGGEQKGSGRFRPSHVDNPSPPPQESAGASSSVRKSVKREEQDPAAVPPGATLNQMIAAAPLPPPLFGGAVAPQPGPGPVVQPVAIPPAVVAAAPLPPPLFGGPAAPVVQPAAVQPILQNGIIPPPPPHPGARVPRVPPVVAAPPAPQPQVLPAQPAAPQQPIIQQVAPQVQPIPPAVIAAAPLPPPLFAPVIQQQAPAPQAPAANDPDIERAEDEGMGAGAPPPPPPLAAPASAPPAVKPAPLPKKDPRADLLAQIHAKRKDSVPPQDLVLPPVSVEVPKANNNAAAAPKDMSAPPPPPPAPQAKSSQGPDLLTQIAAGAKLKLKEEQQPLAEKPSSPPTIRGNLLAEIANSPTLKRKDQQKPLAEKTAAPETEHEKNAAARNAALERRRQALDRSASSISDSDIWSSSSDVGNSSSGGNAGSAHSLAESHLDMGSISTSGFLNPDDQEIEKKMKQYSAGVDTALKQAKAAQKVMEKYKVPQTTIILEGYTTLAQERKQKEEQKRFEEFTRIEAEKDRIKKETAEKSKAAAKAASDKLKTEKKAEKDLSPKIAPKESLLARQIRENAEAEEAKARKSGGKSITDDDEWN